MFVLRLSLQEAHALQEKISAQYKNEIEMAKAQRDYELKKAAYDIEVNTKKAESEMAYQLQVQLDAFLNTKPLSVWQILFHILYILMNPLSSAATSRDSLMQGIFKCILPLPGCKDEAAHRGGEDAGPGG